MARRNAAARTNTEFAVKEPAHAPREVGSEAGVSSILDGARLAQAVLAARLAEEDAAPRWSRRRGLALAIGASASLWMAAAVAIRLVLVK